MGSLSDTTSCVVNYVIAFAFHSVQCIVIYGHRYIMMNLMVNAKMARIQYAESCSPGT